MPCEPRDGDRLAGKVAVVTGAGSDGSFTGIGDAVARLFARQGARVVLFDISRERARVTQGAIAAAGSADAARICVGDVRSKTDCQRAVDDALEGFGALDVLVNNAAVIPASLEPGVDEDDWRRVQEINLLGPTLLSEAAAPHLAQDGGGAIVNISSIAALRGMGAGAYASSKAGLIGLTTDLAYRWARQGIRVNCVAPGHVYAPMGYSDEEYRELRRKAGPLGTEGTPWDVAWACVYLASEEANWVTGVLLPVDGGTISTTAVPMHHLINE